MVGRVGIGLQRNTPRYLQRLFLVGRLQLLFFFFFFSCFSMLSSFYIIHNIIIRLQRVLKQRKKRVLGGKWWWKETWLGVVNTIQCTDDVYLYTWSLYKFVNQCHSNKFNLKNEKNRFTSLTCPPVYIMCVTRI